MSKDPRVEQPAVGASLPAPQEKKKTTVKTTFASEDEAKKFLHAREAERAAASKQAKITLKLTPAQAPQVAPPKLKASSQALRTQAAEITGASRNEKASEGVQRQQGQTATGGIAQKSLPLPQPEITKPQKAVLEALLAKMGTSQALAQQLGDVVLGKSEMPQALLKQLSDAGVKSSAGQGFIALHEGPVTPLTIMFMLLDAHLLNQLINDTAKSASMAAAAMQANADIMQSILDRAMNSVMARCAAQLKALEAFTSLSSGVSKGYSQILKGITNVQRTGASEALRSAQRDEAKLLRLRDAQRAFDAAVAGGDPHALNAAYDELRTARSEAHAQPVLAQRGRELTPSHLTQASTAPRVQGHQTLEAALDAAHIATESAAAAMERTYAEWPDPQEPAATRQARGHLQALRDQAIMSPSGRRLEGIDAQLQTARARLMALRDKPQPLSDADAAELRSLVAQERGLVATRAMYQAAHDAETGSLRAAHTRAEAALSEVEALSVRGALDDQQAQLQGGVLLRAVREYEALVRRPGVSAEEITQAEAVLDAALTHVEQESEGVRLRASGRSPEQVTRTLAVFRQERRASAELLANAAATRANTAATARVDAQIADIDAQLPQLQARLPEITSRIGAIDAELGSTPPPTEAVRQRLQDEKTRLRALTALPAQREALLAQRQALATTAASLQAARAPLEQCRTAAREALAVAHHQGPGKGVARFADPARLSEIDAGLEELHARAHTFAEADGAASAPGAVAVAELDAQARVLRGEQEVLDARKRSIDGRLSAIDARLTALGAQESSERTALNSERARLAARKATLDARSPAITARLTAIETERAERQSAAEVPADVRARREAAAMAYAHARQAAGMRHLVAIAQGWEGPERPRAVSVGIPPSQPARAITRDADEARAYFEAFGPAYADAYRFGSTPNPAGAIWPDLTRANVEVERVLREVPEAERPPAAAATPPSPQRAAYDAALQAKTALEQPPDAARFQAAFGAWVVQDGRYILTGEPPQTAQSFTREELNNPAAILDPARRRAAEAFRLNAANARLQVLGAQTSARLTALGSAHGSRLEAEWQAQEASNEAIRALQAFAGSHPEPRSEADRQEYTRLMGVVTAAQASLDPARSAIDQLPGLLETLDQRQVELQDAVIARDRYGLQHPSPRDADAQREYNRLDGAVRDKQSGVAQAREAVDSAGPARPGYTFWAWCSTYLWGQSSALSIAANVVVNPVAGAFMTASNSMWAAGRSIAASSQQASGEHDAIFNQIHAELKQLEQKTQADWQKKLNAMRSLVEAHIRSA